MFTRAGRPGAEIPGDCVDLPGTGRRCRVLYWTRTYWDSRARRRRGAANLEKGEDAKGSRGLAGPESTCHWQFGAKGRARWLSYEIQTQESTEESQPQS